MSAMNQKLSETGWFYHAPAKKVQKEEPVGAPPPSQIPGMWGTDAPLEKEEPREMVFRDTDTKYIRMAKMGGRKDLLTIRPNQRKKEAVNYPRNDWFYLEDNELEDKAIREKEQEQWEFLLPEYMVHQSHGAPGEEEQRGEGVPMRRPPYAIEDQSQFTRDGRLMTDKTVKLPETRRPGYGVRSNKPPPKGPRPEKPKPLSSQVQGDRPRFKHQPLPPEPEGPTNMGKLLSNTYEREWHDRVDNWHSKQAQQLDKAQVFINKDRAVRSEYSNSYTVSTTASQKPHRRTSSATSSKMSKQKVEQPTKEPFKMSKFKNVPARIDSHQAPEVLAAVGN